MAFLGFGIAFGAAGLERTESILLDLVSNLGKRGLGSSKIKKSGEKITNL